MRTLRRNGPLSWNKWPTCCVFRNGFLVQPARISTKRSPLLPPSGRAVEKDHGSSPTGTEIVPISRASPDDRRANRACHLRFASSLSSSFSAVATIPNAMIAIATIEMPNEPQRTTDCGSE
jgi:hypothetical protein